MSCENKHEIEIEAGMIVKVVMDGKKCRFMSSYGVLKPVNLDPEGQNFIVLSRAACDGTFEEDTILMDRQNGDIIYACEEQLELVGKICPKCRLVIPICSHCGELKNHICCR